MDGFVEEIDFKELNFLEVVGRGAFGVVSRARWRSTDVAVKLIETESEKKAFITELKQLSRVVHPNIVKLYGASRVHPVCLVMEYAEGGSLYNVLHGSGAQPQYTAAHAVSWSLQCACGVSYLHSMKPKPLVHRDLKPPNLLLIAGGTILKICDFGTACDAHTHMTNNKGSAAWMAPEVFEGSSYSEKCDVFSWGIILWEVLTRRKPFDEIGGPAFRIMWAVHNGTRPPMIRSCPKPLEILMCRCWSSNPVERPSMSEVERIMRHLSQFFEGADVPLVYPSVKEDQGENMMTGQSTGAHTIQQTMLLNQSTPPPTQPPTHDPPPGDLVNLPPVSAPKHVVVVEEEEGGEDVSDQRRTSAPASLAASREHLPPTHHPTSALAQFANKRFSADLSKLDEQDLISKMNSGMEGVAPQPARPAGSGHRRTGSHGTSGIVTSSTPELTSTDRLPHVTTAPDLGSHHTVSGYPVTGVGSPVMTNMAQRSTSWAPGMPNTNLQGLLGDKPSLNLISLDHELRPLPPCATCPESVSIHNQHCRYAYNYLQVQTEIALLKQQKDQLEDALMEDQQKKQDAFRFIEEYTRLVNDNEQLAMLQKNLTRQLEGLKKIHPNRFGF